MRTIKFRFWTPDKRMLDDHEGWVEYIGINYALECSKDYGYVAMQFIELKDKNEKEIYAGDIVFGWGVNFVVEYLHGSAGYYTGVDTNWKEFHAFATHNHLSINNGVCKQLEVVGNIYETPNLMSGRHEA